jgi:hypothetical protein
MERVYSADPNLLIDVTFPQGRTAKEILPSAWIEPFNEPMYLQELEVLVAFIQAVQQIADKLVEEAIPILKGEK